MGINNDCTVADPGFRVEGGAKACQSKTNIGLQFLAILWWDELFVKQTETGPAQSAGVCYIIVTMVILQESVDERSRDE